MELQRTEEWRQQRLGKVGASRIADLMAKTKTGYGASRANLMAELICERITGVPAEGYSSPAMAWGIETEIAAKAAYCFHTDLEIQEAGFIDHPHIAMAGCSPDGFVDNDGLIEIKCPNTATHIDTLLTESVPGKYMLQMQFQMAVTGLTWCDFVSFDPRVPRQMQLFVKRIYYLPDTVAEIETEVRKFLVELDAKVAALRAKFLREAA